MNSKLQGTVRAVVAMACLALPLAALGATKAELQQKAQAHKAQTGVKASAKATDKKAAKEQKKALRAKKASLMKERHALSKQGNIAALQANTAKMDAVDAELNAVQKGGAKK